MMRLTIIKPDNSVYIDLVPYSPLDMSSVPSNVHALQWLETYGWVEFNDGTLNQDITELPNWVAPCIQEWQSADYRKKNPTHIPPTAETNKITAMELLQQTDWTSLPDVADPSKSNPYLANAADFNVYRNAIRQIAINPTAGDIDWAVMPQAVWQQV